MSEAAQALGPEARSTIPASTPAYSNYATALAGYIVSRVSGEPFDNYIERHIFAPLGMRHSTFRQPLPAKSQAVRWPRAIRRGKDEPYGYEYVGPAPAGSLAASGDDMGRFMIAHLQNGGAAAAAADRAADALDRQHADPRPAKPCRSASTSPTSTAAG